MKTLNASKMKVIQRAYNKTIGATILTSIIYIKEFGALVSDNMEHTKYSVFASNKEINKFVH